MYRDPFQLAAEVPEGYVEPAQCVHDRTGTPHEVQRPVERAHQRFVRRVASHGQGAHPVPDDGRQRIEVGAV